jgi:hypothetical protein
MTLVRIACLLRFLIRLVEAGVIPDHFHVVIRPQCESGGIRSPATDPIVPDTSTAHQRASLLPF